MIDKNNLIAWLKNMDRKLKRKITLIAVGGTAMTLLGLKASTIDIDFSISHDDRAEFEKVLNKEFKVDIFTDGYIFSEQLPGDYQEKAREIMKMKNIILKALSPTDIVITKAARLNARDEEDILDDGCAVGTFWTLHQMPFSLAPCLSEALTWFTSFASAARLVS